MVKWDGGEGKKIFFPQTCNRRDGESKRGRTRVVKWDGGEGKKIFFPQTCNRRDGESKRGRTRECMLLYTNTPLGR